MSNTLQNISLPTLSLSYMPGLHCKEDISCFCFESSRLSVYLEKRQMVYFTNRLHTVRLTDKHICTEPTFSYREKAAAANTMHYQHQKTIQAYFQHKYLTRSITVYTAVHALKRGHMFTMLISQFKC